MKRNAARFPDGTPKCLRLYRRTGEPWHYKHESGEETVCGIALDDFNRRHECMDTMTNGKPLPICGHCRRRAGR